MVDSWPTRRDQPVSVALSPAGDRLALSVGQRLSVSDIADGVPRRAAAPAWPARWRPGSPGRRAATSSRSVTRTARAGSSSCPGRSPPPGRRPGCTALGTAQRAGLRSRRRPAGRAGAVIAGPDDAHGHRSRTGGLIWERVLTRNRMSGYSPGRGQPGLVARRAPAGLHHGDVDGLGIRYRHRAAGAAVRRSLADRHRPQLDRRRMDPLGLHGRDAAGMAPGRLRVLDRRGDHRGGGDGLRARAAHRADLVGAEASCLPGPWRGPPPSCGTGTRRRATSPRTSPGWRSAPWTACWR